FRNTLKAYSVPNGRLTRVAATSAAAPRCAGFNGRAALAPALARALARGLRRLLRLGDLLAGAALELGRDVVVDPLRVPPLHRQHRHAGEVDAEVQVVARGEAGLAALAEGLLRLHRVAGLHLDRAEVAVQSVEADAVVEDHAIAVDAEVAGEGHRAAVRGFHRV